MKKKNKQPKILGYVAVDSGQVIICDPCYLAEWRDGRHDKTNNHYGKCCSTSEKGGGEVLISGKGGKGVCAQSGLGDGLYPVTAQYKDNAISALTIDFLL